MAVGTEIDGRKIRVDYSITQRAHTPTPGVYLGRPMGLIYTSTFSTRDFSQGGHGSLKVPEKNIPVFQDVESAWQPNRVLQVFEF